ncbi:unnamed protein product [Heterobilharzia americana]|nr:unnamed protein product [Heterobilharzia americana]
MSRRFKKEKTGEFCNQSGSSINHSNFLHSDQHWDSTTQLNMQRNDVNIREQHPYAPPTCLHLPPSYISHMNCSSNVNSNSDSNNNNNNNNNNSANSEKHGSQSFVEKLIFRIIKCFEKKSDNTTNECTNEDYVHSDALLEEHPLLSNRDDYNSSHIFPCANVVTSTGQDIATSTTSASINPNEVEDWMRRRLYYHFMTPIGKFQAKRRIPFKLFIQIFKVLLVTIQFNKTKELAIGGYLFDSEYPTMKLCMRYISPPLENEKSIFRLAIHEVEKCVSIEPAKIDSEKLKDVDSIKVFLRSYELNINFDHLVGFDIYFNLLSPPIYHMDWTQTIECYRFMIKISLENPSQSGQMKIRLHAPYASTPCIDIPKQVNNASNLSTYSQVLSIPLSTTLLSTLPTETSSSSSSSSEDGPHRNKKQRILVQFWNQFNTTSKISIETNYILPRGILVIIIDSCTLILGIISCILCIRSIIQGFHMWLETVRFFKHWFGIQLDGVFWEFIRPWILFIIINDMIIITTSVYALSTLNRMHVKYEPLTYLMGVGALLVWIGILYYVGFSYDNSLLIRTISRSIPGLLRFCVCALILFFAFSLCGWVVLGPYNIKFRTFMSTVECLYSLINGDDMFVTFTIINENDPMGIYLFSRLFLYLFITLFIYVVLNLFVTIIFEAYEEVKDMQNSHGRPNDSPLWHFVCQHNYSPKSPIFKADEIRPDRHLLQEHAQGSKRRKGRSSSSDCFNSMPITSIRALLKFQSIIKCQQRQFTENERSYQQLLHHYGQQLNENNQQCCEQFQSSEVNHTILENDIIYEKSLLINQIDSNNHHIDNQVIDGTNNITCVPGGSTTLKKDDISPLSNNNTYDDNNYKSINV